MSELGPIQIGESVLIPWGPMHVEAIVSVVQPDGRVVLDIRTGDGTAWLPAVPAHWLLRGPEIVAYRTYRKIIEAPNLHSQKSDN